MKMTPRSALLALAVLGTAVSGPVSSAQAQAPAGPAGPTVTTTKVLAIGHIAAGTTREGARAVMPAEVRATVKLYLAGKIDQWYVRQDQNGVVFLMNVATVEEACGLLERLPLGEAKIMEFDLIPLGPLSPLGLLVGPAVTTAAPSTPPVK